MLGPVAGALAGYLIENPELAGRHEIDFDGAPEEIQDIFYLRNDDWVWEIDYDGGCDWD